MRISGTATFALCAVVLQTIAGCTPKQTATQAQQQCRLARTCVEKNLAHIGESIDKRLSAFAMSVASSQPFAMKLLVEKDATAPEVTEITASYIGPMDFTLLSITDASGKIISCGHFPASVGNSVSESVAALKDKALCAVDMVKGDLALTLQSRRKIALEGTALYAVGGVVLNGQALKALVPWNGVLLIVKAGSIILSSEGDVQTMSSVSNGTMIVNNVSYFADSCTLAAPPPVTAPMLYILLAKSTPVQPQLN